MRRFAGRPVVPAPRYARAAVHPRTIDLGDGRRVRALDEGSGRPIVLLHGWPTNANAWGRQLVGLPGHRVLALDLPGFGLSPPPAEHTMAELARTVRDVLVHEEIDDAILVGWSMGGCVVLAYCERFGTERLRGIGIVDVSPRLLPGPGWAQGEGTPFSGEGLEQWRAGWLSDPRAVATDVYTIGIADLERHAREREWLVEESLKASGEPAIALLLDAFHADYRAVLPTIDVPALLLYGAHSTSTTPWVRAYTERELPDAEAVVFERSSHCPMLEETARFNAALDAFARRVG